MSMTTETRSMSARVAIPVARVTVMLAILVIVGAVLGGVLGSRAVNKNNNNGGSGGTSSGASSGGNAPADPSAAASAEQAIGIYATATNSYYMVRLYPSTTNTAAFTTPTIIDTTDPFCPLSFLRLAFFFSFLVVVVLFSANAMANQDASDSAAGLVKPPKKGISNWIKFGVPVANSTNTPQLRFA